MKLYARRGDLSTKSPAEYHGLKSPKEMKKSPLNMSGRSWIDARLMKFRLKLQ